MFHITSFLGDRLSTMGWIVGRFVVGTCGNIALLNHVGVLNIEADLWALFGFLFLGYIGLQTYVSIQCQRQRLMNDGEEMSENEREAFARGLKAGGSHKRFDEGYNTGMKHAVSMNLACMEKFFGEETTIAFQEYVQDVDMEDLKDQ